MDAVEAAVAVAREHGIDASSAVVLGAGINTLVHLAPAPVVARVASWRREEAVRELAVVAHAARAGAPVVPPTDVLPPGPHELGGYTLTFRRFVEERGERDAAEIGRRLREVHEALADFPQPLPQAGHSDDVLTILDRLPPELAFLRDVPDPALPGHALHGDAHLNNTIPTAEGPLWTDFECACCGPPEADLACLVLRDRIHGPLPEVRAALDAYGPYDAELVEAYVPVQARYVTVWVTFLAMRNPAAFATVARERLAWFRAQAREM